MDKKYAEHCNPKGRSYEDVFPKFWYHLRVYSRWYHVSTPIIWVGTGIILVSWYQFVIPFWPPPKRYHVNLFAFLTYFYNTKHDDLGGRRASLFGARSSNKRENSTQVVWSTKTHFCFSSCRCLVNPACHQICNHKRQELLLLFRIIAKDVAQDDWDACEGAGCCSRL
jgi:hypothetical protein